MIETVASKDCGYAARIVNRKAVTNKEKKPIMDFQNLDVFRNSKQKVLVRDSAIARINPTERRKTKRAS